ncbi:MAG: VacB/RNase II family 3'-5' exoribonuclease [Sedimentisphaerales bacterium]|nr:VacB/RNase II family 3'-5' exoribonuclease [Sedimentisphaerales bacterium]
MPQRFTNRILRLITRRDYQPQKMRPLARALNVEDTDYDAFRSALEKLRQEGRIVLGPRGVVTLPEMTDRIVGTYEATRHGYGFVRPDTPAVQGDLYIPIGQGRDAVTGDRVVARVLRRRGGAGATRLSGSIVEILSRGQSECTGSLFQEAGQWFVQPDGRSLTERISVGDPGAKQARAGDKVLVEILSYPTPKYYAQGVILETLGRAGLARTELLSVIRRYQLPDVFDRRVRGEARRVTGSYDPEDLIRRLLRQDIRNQTVITIDPTDARDFDDAISLRRLAGGHWLLGVHIADVGYFVLPESPLDAEARRRGNSVYLPQHVIPMLPEVLSNGLCSLQEGQDRLVKSVYIELDDLGQVQRTEFANSVMRSTCRLTYDQVDEILAGRPGPVARRVVNLLGKLERLARILQKRRRRNGMLTLELPKCELSFDDQGQAVDARPESTSFSHTMIEMFMVEANEAVARLLDGLRVPFLRRIHPEPDALAAGETARIVKICGYMIPKNINRQGLQDLLDRVRGKPESFLINLAVLKSLQPAEYSPAPIGHYALASRFYCHFTSPIRRFPDLTIHRLLEAYLTGRLTAQTIRDFPDYELLDELGQNCTRTERQAEQAEREMSDFHICQMLSHRVGQTFAGVVTSIVPFGVFVQLEQYLIETLLRVEDIARWQSAQAGPAGKSKHRASHPHRGRRLGRGGSHQSFAEWCPFRLGQEIQIRLVSVNVPTRQFEIVPA